MFLSLFVIAYGFYNLPLNLYLIIYFLFTKKEKIKRTRERESRVNVGEFQTSLALVSRKLKTRKCVNITLVWNISKLSRHCMVYSVHFNYRIYIILPRNQWSTSLRLPAAHQSIMHTPQEINRGYVMYDTLSIIIIWCGSLWCFNVCIGFITVLNHK